MTAYYFVQPLDVLMLRGNKGFGDAGEHGEAVMPPWPSLFAGAFRSALLSGDAGRLAQFVALGTSRDLSADAQREQTRALLGEALFKSLGTPNQPGDFRITWVSLARCINGAVFAAVPLPADLAAFDEPGMESLIPLRPAPLPLGVEANGALPITALLRTPKLVKQSAGRWLDGHGLAAHLSGAVPASTSGTDALYKRETRLGIALDPGSRTASEGALYTTEAVAMREDAGFLVGIEGDHGQLPDSGLLRLGGDGKGAHYRMAREFSAPAPTAVNPGGRFRLILSTPGIFTGGWLPEYVIRQKTGEHRMQAPGFGARLACAALARHEVISGWDLAHWRPKTAQRVAPAGSVYWFDEFSGDAGKLAAWVAGGLWGDNPDIQRRAEGFNRAWLAAWSES